MINKDEEWYLWDRQSCFVTLSLFLRSMSKYMLSFEKLLLVVCYLPMKLQSSA